MVRSLTCFSRLKQTQQQQYCAQKQQQKCCGRRRKVLPHKLNKQQQEPNVPSLGRKEPSSEVKSDSVLCHEHASSSKSERCVERRRNSHAFPLTLGIEMANCVLAEADALVGDAQRAP